MPASLVELTVVNGNLHITIAEGQRGGVQELADAGYSSDATLGELLEWHLCNGWEWVPPEDIGALTDSPILSQEVERDDRGYISRVGRVFWYPEYQVYDPVQVLLEKGLVVFTGVE